MSKSLVGVQRYNKLNRPWRQIAIWSLLLVSIAITLVYYFLFDTEFMPHGLRQDRITFIAYLCFFAAVWIVYFRSKRYLGTLDKQGNIHGIQSLRRLLGETSVHWDYNPENEQTEDIKEAFRRKASTSMEVIAILIAVSVLILDIASNLWAGGNSGLDSWNEYSIGIAALFAIVSFASFVISVDALDTLFNRFSTTVDRNVIVHYFYHVTINPKYYGMVSMMLAVVFLLQVFHTMLASIAIAIILTIGSSLWFPKLTKTLKSFHLCDEQESCELTVVQRFILRCFIIIFISAPVIVHYLA